VLLTARVRCRQLIFHRASGRRFLQACLLLLTNLLSSVFQHSCRFVTCLTTKQRLAAQVALAAAGFPASTAGEAATRRRRYWRTGQHTIVRIEQPCRVGISQEECGAATFELEELPYLSGHPLGLC
jgi:hypothetical protein